MTKHYSRHHVLGTTVVGNKLRIQTEEIHKQRYNMLTTENIPTPINAYTSDDNNTV